MNYEDYYSINGSKMKASAIRELLKLVSQPGIISFAGGLPAPDMFPVEEIKEMSNYVLDKKGSLALQYGSTEGYQELKEELLKVLKKDGIEKNMEEILVITSSQQGLDLCGKIFVSPGDIVMVGRPTYVGGIQAFEAYGGDLRGVESDEQGMRADDLDKKVSELISMGKKPKFVYIIPDFQNPSGITMSKQRRLDIIEVARKHDLLIVEDSPYRQLRFEGEHKETLISQAPERVIGLYTFSKILLPGFRLGWLAGPKELVKKFAIAKQSVDLCAPPFNQMILAEYLKRGLLDKQIEKIIKAYRVKRDFMLEKLTQYFPKEKGVKWTEPNGGLFLWLTFPAQTDAQELLKKAIDNKVAYVVGSAFYSGGNGGKNCCRLNFSYAGLEQIEQGIKRLSNLI